MSQWFIFLRKLKCLWILILVVWPSLALASQAIDDPSLAELQTSITALQTRLKAPGLAVSVIDPQHPQGNWIYTSGLANVDSAAPVTEDTVFRMGSISKMLVSVAVMSLVEQNKLTLNTPVKALLPNLVFSNPWKKSHPLRVAHLLNHTSGWDAPHFSEKAKHDNAPLTLKDALSIYPESRTSRWPPGTRTAYNNTAPTVAAYLVEQLTGMTFEAYVSVTIFAPLGMQNSGYFYNDDYRAKGAALYRGGQPIPYREINYRPSGALNSNAKDMMALLQFFLRQRSLQAVSRAAISDMERVDYSQAAQSGLAFGYGQGMMHYQVNGWVFYGHEGSVRGGTAMLVYQPQLQKGYVIMANSEGPLVSGVHRLLSAYLTKGLAKKPVSIERSTSELHQRQAGLYRLISPTLARLDPFTRLFPWRLTVSETSASIALPGVTPRPLIADKNGHFAQAETGLRVLIGTLDQLDGEVLHYGPNTLKKISLLSAYFPLLVLALWLLMTVVTLFRWMYQVLRRKVLSAFERRQIRWPRLAALSMLITLLALIFILRSNEPYAAAQPGVLSVTVMLASLAFFIFAMLGAYQAAKGAVQPQSKLKTGYGLAQMGANFLVAMYLLSHGMIGLMLWT